MGERRAARIGPDGDGRPDRPSRPEIVDRMGRATTRDSMPLAIQGDAFPNPLEWGGEARPGSTSPRPANASRGHGPGPRDSRCSMRRLRRPLGVLSMRGAMNLSPTRPTAVAIAARRGLIAVATRLGRRPPDCRPERFGSSGSRGLRIGVRAEIENPARQGVATSIRMVRRGSTGEEERAGPAYDRSPSRGSDQEDCKVPISGLR